MNENNIVKTELQTPIEIALQIDSDGMTTARKLYEFLELEPSHYARWCKSNITGNEFATENEDYFYSPSMANEQGRGNFADDYKLTAHFAKKLSMKGNGERAEQAREYFTMVEERAKQISINRSVLSPQIQAIYAMLDEQAKIEMEQKRQAEHIGKVETKIDNMQSIMTEPIGDWKSEINSRVREISVKSGIDYKELYNRLYGELETTAHCSLKRLQDNKKRRMEMYGNTKSAIKNETTKIAIIYEKPQLKAIFESIVRKYAMSYCA
jgi:anti-repressor protein